MPQKISVGIDGWERYDKVFFKEDGSDLGKINLNQQPIFSNHRSGWEYAIDSLMPLHNEEGIFFDGFLENRFTWKYKDSIKNKIIPYEEPWVGFVHNPVINPSHFFSKSYSTESLLKKEEFKKSLENCKGIFTLSKYLSNYIYDNVKITTCSLILPTLIPDLIFNYEKFIANKSKKIINIGYWLRKLNSIFLLPLDDDSGYTKIRLRPYDSKSPISVINKITDIEKKELKLNFQDEDLKRYRLNTKTFKRLDDHIYDEMLSENLVFLDLYDSSANNAITECIARATPVLVNRIPAVEEYLGEDYPFYFDSLERAAEKALDFELIKETHEYLLNWEVRKKLTQEYFRESLRNSKIYQEL